MIDNPLPDQVMAEMDKLAQARNFEEKCRDDAKELCEDNYVFDSLIEHFQDWYFLYRTDHPEDQLDGDKDLIDSWWDEEGDLYDDYISPYKDFDPTPQYLYDHTGGEPPISAEERNRNSLDSKRESHGHRYYPHYGYPSTW